MGESKLESSYVIRCKKPYEFHFSFNHTCDKTENTKENFSTFATFFYCIWQIRINDSVSSDAIQKDYAGEKHQLWE